ncbi:MAG TPA: hypothetical protein PLA25_12525 [Anaerolineaceae bacterium]|nr:hypothetical protein [Anaerolineaceae bacterium]
MNSPYNIGDQVQYTTLNGLPVVATVTAIYDNWRGTPGVIRIEISWETGRYATVKPDQIKPLERTKK